MGEGGTKKKSIANKKMFKQKKRLGLDSKIF